MKIYWYAPWPEDRAWVSMSLAEKVAGDSHQVVLQRLRPAVGSEPSIGNGRVRVVADLPIVSPARPWTPRWLADRAALVIRRAWNRNRLIRRVGPDVIHLQLLNRFTDLWMMPPGPVVATVHDVLPHERRLPLWAERMVLARLYGSLAAVVVHHRAVGQQLQDDFAVSGNRIHCIPLLIAPNQRPSVERTLEAPAVLFFGAFRRNKGVEQLSEAVGLLASDAHIRFHFAGRGDAGTEQIVRQLAERDPRVTAELGYVSTDVKDTLFRTASLVVLPYTTFTSQSAVLGDAYAAGTPVLVTDVGALGASVREDGTGWVLASSRPEDIAESIRRALSDRPAWEERAERCRAVARERSPERIAASYRGLYEPLHPR